MPEPFKNLFNKKIIHAMARSFQKQWSDFDSEGFFSAATKNLQDLELKQRSDQIKDAMSVYLPNDFSLSGQIMLASLSPTPEGDIFGIEADDNGISGWAIMPMSHYVGLFGHDEFDLSMTLFKEMTKRFSSEFGIRFFLLQEPEKTLSVLKQWTEDEDRHVRRLVSEGTRPRLPWAMQLPLFIEDPSAIIGLIENLKDDGEEYVRRSVANNLNDIAKDHPDVVAEIAKKWMRGANAEREKLVRHGCRTLIKNGNKKVLKTFGYQAPDISAAIIEIKTPEVMFGSALEFSVTISSACARDQPLLIDYIIHHRKANGSTSAKVFKWSDKVLLPNQVLISTKKHGFKKITTRVYYPGVHSVEVVVNGVSVAKDDFTLLMGD